jgi:hypothetical protein
MTTPTMTSPSITDSTVLLSGGTPDLDFAVSNNGTTSYIIDLAFNPTITLVKGRTYTFNITTEGQPFWIQTTPAPYNSANVVTSGITNNGTQSGTLTYTVPSDGSVTTLYYVAEANPTMTGTINIIDVPSFTTTVKSVEASSAKQIVFPDANGTVITTGNLADIVSLGQIVSVYAKGPVVGHPNIYNVTDPTTILVPGFDGGIVVTKSATATTVQVPNDFIDDPASNFPVGSQVTVIQYGAGQVTFAGSGTATVSGSPGLKLRAQYSSATLIKIEVNTWVVSGDLVA